MAVRKTTKRPEAKAPERIKVNIVLPADQELMLGVVASHRRMSKSAFISEALKPCLAGYYVTRRGTGPGSDQADAPPLDALHAA